MHEATMQIRFPNDDMVLRYRHYSKWVVLTKGDCRLYTEKHPQTFISKSKAQLAHTRANTLEPIEAVILRGICGVTSPRERVGAESRA